MSEDVTNELDRCVALIRTAPIEDATRLHLTSQATVYALFLSDLQAGRLPAEQVDAGVVPSMLELITVFCNQVTEILGSHDAA
ncbi:hypothetical protein [Stutzerimonas stutzeri]|uniref:hypothetical protein n=1 Tax=Stutzerimonas stutzeri TaxID=316 RepID=UPI0015E326CB|nr:hypothetical protein [Stutzerimonas stutzeri]MBA1280320.1 hypothetical protein [Stutzerimonas stutzeri]